LNNENLRSIQFQFQFKKEFIMTKKQLGKFIFFACFTLLFVVFLAALCGDYGIITIETYKIILGWILFCTLPLIGLLVLDWLDSYNT